MVQGPGWEQALLDSRIDVRQASGFNCKART